MAYVINSDCIQCGACESECEKGAISLLDDGNYAVDPAKCEECGDCQDVCPTGAIGPA